MSTYKNLAELQRRITSELECIDKKLECDTFVSQASIGAHIFERIGYKFEHCATLIDINRQALIDTRDILAVELDKITTKLDAVEALLND